MSVAPAPHAAALAALPLRTGEVELLGSTTRYWDYGPQNARRTIVICHGYRGDHHGLEPVIAKLPDIRVVSPDLPGFGGSTPMTDETHSIAGYARWFTEFVRALRLDQAVVLGHSFGSIVTAHAVAAGLTPPALILVNPIASDPAKVGGAGITRLYYGLARRVPERLGRALLASPLIVSVMSRTLVKTPDAALRRWIHQEHHRYFSAFSDVRTVAEGFDASLSSQVGDAAARVAVPTLLIAGDADHIAPVAGARETVSRFPDGRLVVLPGVGHLIHYEAADGAAAAIQEFLTGLRSGRRGVDA
jgi:pimeloyl-ACP methyl ester carboxylesterase